MLVITIKNYEIRNMGGRVKMSNFQKGNRKSMGQKNGTDEPICTGSMKMQIWGTDLWMQVGKGRRGWDELRE